VAAPSGRHLAVWHRRGAPLNLSAHICSQGAAQPQFTAVNCVADAPSMQVSAHSSGRRAPCAGESVTLPEAREVAVYRGKLRQIHRNVQRVDTKISHSNRTLWWSVST
jgi:hypothetical protein